MTELTELQAPGSTTAAPALPPELERTDVWTDAAVATAGLRIEDAPFVTVGGGMGSFVLVDYLRAIGGLPAEDIRVLSNLDHPWQTYEYLTRVSQLPRHRRIRSDSASRPDNLWGFPSYAWQEAVRERTLKPIVQVLLEPVFADFYTPKLSAVLENLEREAHRIRYWDMLRRGEVWLVRRRVGGGYFVVLDPRDGPPLAYRCRDVHVAVGYTGLRYLPDMRRFRERFGDFHHVVNGYEDHEHVYESLRTRPDSTVLVRGGGIVTSAVVERLLADRARYGLRTRVVHLFRNYVAGAHGPHAWSRRRGSNGYAYQGFNYPKSTWGGQVKKQMRSLEGRDRARLYDQIGGTTTASRRHWQRRIEDGRATGAYRSVIGTIEELRLDRSSVLVDLDGPDGRQQIRADYVIDCTGLDGDITGHRVLRDLLQHSGARRNPLGRLDVEPSFELRGAASGDGHVYVTGAASYGGYFPGVDTFLGLQISAQEVADDLARRGHCRGAGAVRSTAGWLKWMRGREL